MSKRAIYNERVSNPSESDEFFPTPPWATRALIKYALPYISGEVIDEPACGAGHMAEVLKSYGCEVVTSDIQKIGGYNPDHIVNYLDPDLCSGISDRMITNPPFNLALEFIQKGLRETDKGVAVLVRSNFMESKSRYEKLFCDTPPTKIFQFVERVPFNYGFVGQRSNLPGAYSWVVWEHGKEREPLQWIPPCRKELELEGEWTPQCSFKRNGSKVCCNPVESEGDICDKHKGEAE